MEDGVLLYYSYANIDGDLREFAEWFKAQSEGLVGRVRVARQGVNATVGGSVRALEQHIARTRARRPDVFGGVRMHIEAVDDPKFEDLRKETGFDALRVRVVDELVTYRAGGGSSVAIRRLSRREWDAALRRPDVTVVDVRNAYESAIGRFEGRARVLTPNLRSTSDFQKWLDSAPIHGDVHAYCTGGVRCEHAARLLAATLGCHAVSVLEGGVAHYLRQVAADGDLDASSFHGRLFVFDPRVSVPGFKDARPRATNLCANCKKLHVQDYCAPGRSRRHRCAHCRVLLLVCDSCPSSDDDSLYCPTCLDHERSKMS